MVAATYSSQGPGNKERLHTREGAYQHLMNSHDREMFKWVKAFNLYDLYSKGDEAPNLDELRPYYQDLIAEYYPEKIRW